MSLLNSSKPKIAYIVSRFPYPLEKGDKLRAYHQLKELAKKSEVHLFALHKEHLSESQRQAMNEIGVILHSYKLNSLVILIQTFLQFFTRKPFQVGYFYQRTIKKKIHSEIRNIDPNHIICQLIRTAEYVKDLHEYSKTLDYMDALSKGMERRIGKEGWFKNIFIKWEYRKLKDYENAVFHYFDHHSIISEQDRECIFHRLRNEIEIVKNGIDTDFFKTSSSSKKYEIGFVGNLSYPPNVLACQRLATKILPILKEKGVSPKLLLSGASPSKEVLKLKSEDVEITGWVEDIRNSYDSMKVFVAPLEIGTGLQNKLLEAMSMQVPCVTTKLVNNALSAENGVNILLADNDQDIANEIIRLLENDSLAISVGAQGRSFVSENYNWKATTDQLLALIQS